MMNQLMDLIVRIQTLMLIIKVNFLLIYVRFFHCFKLNILTYKITNVFDGKYRFYKGDRKSQSGMLLEDLRWREPRNYIYKILHKKLT